MLRNLICSRHSSSYPVEQVETRFTEIKHINQPVGTHVAQCTQSHPPTAVNSDTEICLSSKATRALWWMKAAVASPNEGDDKRGGINPLRA